MSFFTFFALFGLSLKLLPNFILTWDFTIVARLFYTHYLVPIKLIVFASLSYLLFLTSVFLNFSGVDLGEFLKSFVNFSLFVLALCTVYNLKEQSFNFMFNHLSKVILGFSVLQVIGYIFYNSEFFFFLLNDISISTADDIGRFEAVNLLGYMRPFAQYHEPSYMALVANIILAMKLTHRKGFDWYCILAIVLSFSIVGFLTLLLTIFFYLRVNLRIIWAGVSLVCLVYFSSFFRFEEILKPGTSGHERIGVVLDTFDYLTLNNLVPMPLGNWEKLPNNSLQVIIGYYSVFSVFFMLFVLHEVRPRLYGALFGLMITNGALLTFTGGFLLGLLFWKKRF